MQSENERNLHSRHKSVPTHANKLLPVCSCCIPVKERFGVLTWPIGVALAEGGVGEAHRAVADDDKAWQAGELRVVH